MIGVQEVLTPFLDDEDMESGLLNHITEIEDGGIPIDSALETVRIQRDRAGNVVLATTQKLANLRFNLGDLLLEAAAGGVTAAGGLGQPLRLVVAGLRFLRAARKLATLDISPEDAEMLIAIFRLTQEEGKARVDDLPQLLPAGWDAADIAGSLERLELLASIELESDKIVLSETIFVQQRD